MSVSDRYEHTVRSFPEYVWRFRDQEGNVFMQVEACDPTRRASRTSRWVDAHYRPVQLPPQFPEGVQCKPLCQHLASGEPAYQLAIPKNPDDLTEGMRESCSWIIGLDASLCLLCGSWFADLGMVAEIRALKSAQRASAFDLVEEDRGAVKKPSGQESEQLMLMKTQTKPSDHLLDPEEEGVQ